jgi:hypothetical protein
MEIAEARPATKSLYLLAASLSGLDVGAASAEALADLVSQGFDTVEFHRRPEAVANLLRVIASTLEVAQEQGQPVLHEDTLRGGARTGLPSLSIRLITWMQ